MLQQIAHYAPAIAIFVLFVLTMVYIRLARRWGAVAKAIMGPDKDAALAKVAQYDGSWMVCAAGIVVIGVVLKPWN